MIKGLLIDLGNTIVYNRDFDFNKGLKKIYDLAICPQITYDQFQEFNKHLKTKTYDNREDIEIKLIDYLSFVISYFSLQYNLSISNLEIEFVKAAEHLELIPGIKNVLQYCRKNNIRVVVLSNSTFSKKAIIEQLKPLNIIPLIDEFLISSENIFRKPESLFFQLGIKMLNQKNEDILYVGNDYEFDIIGAYQAGLKVCWFNELHLPNHLYLNCFDFDKYDKLLFYLEGQNDKVF